MLRILTSLFVGAILAIPAALGQDILDEILQGDDQSFSEFEIRVIRPRYFTKRRRLELGVQGIFVANETFIYTYLASGIVAYHFSELWGVEWMGAYGSVVDKDDKKQLQHDFNIQTQILRPKMFTSANLLWTPIYGKYQLSSGRLIYFDTFLSGGFGLTGVEYKYSQCSPSPSPGEHGSTDTSIYQYPTTGFGIGQRVFLNTESSVRWDIREWLFTYKTADGACNPSQSASSSVLHNSVTVQLGYSRFF